MSLDANEALRLSFASNRADRRGARRLARATAAATARRLRMARRLFGSTTISAMERVEDMLPEENLHTVDPVAAFLLDQAERDAVSVPAAIIVGSHEPPPPPRLADVTLSITAPRPGPAAGIAPAA